MKISAFILILFAFIFLGFQDKTIPIVDFKGLKPLLHKQNDTTYVVNFWATWCKPCVTELPNFEQITKKYKGQKVKVVLVSLDFPKTYQSQLVPFVLKKGIKSEVILLNDPNSNDWISQVDENWSGAIPATLVYNSKSRTFYEQAFDFNELDSVLNLKLNKP